MIDTVEVVLAAWTGVLGLLIGSFLNVVIWRVPRGESIVTPPSSCPRCGTPIKPRDNLPVLGWLLLRGRCRECAEPISVRYPLVEAGTGLLFAALSLRLGFEVDLVAFLWLGALGVALALIDLDTQRLPNVLTGTLAAGVAILLGTAALVDHAGGPAVRALVGALALGGFYFVVWFIHPGGMGFGDVKLAPSLGAALAWLGYGSLAVGAFLGFLYGAVVGVALVGLSKAGRKTRIPFGPFMVAGALTAVFAGEAIADLYSRLLVS